MEESRCDIQLLHPDQYFHEKGFASYSSIKMFSQCETLFRDVHLDKTYEEPDKDYYIYGALVDAMVTEGPEYVAANFVRVDRKVNTEDALKFENKIKDLNAEIKKKEQELEAKKAVKAEVFYKKIEKTNEKIAALKKKNKDADVVDILEEQMNLQNAIREIEPDKTLAKGIESRKNEILEIQKSLGNIAELAKKQQVTGAIWDNAEGSALALKSHPYYSQMEFNGHTSQQIFACIIDGIPRKGKLDHLKLSPAMARIYSVWVAGQLTTEDFQKQLTEIHPQDRWAIITDIKTCFSMEKLEPFNKHYRGQLRFYQDLVHRCLGIPLENIRNQIFVADKTNNSFKMAELLVYPQNTLDELWPDILAWMQIWKNAMDTKTFVSDKAKNGMHQKCFSCTECRVSPFSKAGEPVVITGPRFESNK